MSHDWSKALGLRKSSEPEKVEPERPPEPESKAPVWKPNRKDYDEINIVVKADHIRSTPLQYGSLADMTPEQIDGIERTAMVDIRRTFDHQGLTLDETSLRAHWAFVVEGYGFPMPPGYIHPEAPPEEAQKAREGWARSVQGAADSVLKQIFLSVWRRRALPTPPKGPRSIGTSSEAYVRAYEKLNAAIMCCNEVFPTEADLREHVDRVHPLPESRENDFKILGEG